MVYFTSDLHLNHDREFIYQNRGFSGIRSHDKAVIDNINEVVMPDDELFILGDLCMGDVGDPETRSYVKDLLLSIKCDNIRVVLGNHDSANKISLYTLCGYEILGYSQLWIHKKHPYLLSHYPTLTQNGRYKGDLCKEVINLYGHTHQQDSFLSINGEIWPLSFHVGLDSNDMRPVSIEKIRQLVHEQYDKIMTEDKNKDSDDVEIAEIELA